MKRGMDARRVALWVAVVATGVGVGGAEGCRRSAGTGHDSSSHDSSYAAVNERSAGGATGAAEGGVPSKSASAMVEGGLHESVVIDVALAGDVIPQVKVLANPIGQVLAGMPAWWGGVDARAVNLEGPIGERSALPGDRQVLSYAAPAGWFADLYAASGASAFVAANNHACDLGPSGLAGTVGEAEKLSAPLVGVSRGDPWERVELVERGGRRVCIVAWTTFLNDEGKHAKRQRACIDGGEATGEEGPRVARAELGRNGLDVIHAELGGPRRWEGCDARIAFVHGGREYQPQIRPVLEQALAAAAYVDAVVVSHPHVPDLAEVIAAPAPKTAGSAGGRAVGRGVPLYRSLGNFVSNQGIAWTPGMSVGLLEREGVPDPIRTVWTRVAMVARLRYAWAPGAPVGAPPSSVKWGYSLLFTDRGGAASIDIRLRALAGAEGDAVEAKLRKAPPPFGELFSAPCRIEGEAPPMCDALPEAALEAGPG